MKTPIHAPKMGVWEFDPLNGEQYQRDPPKALALRGNTSL